MYSIKWHKWYHFIILVESLTLSTKMYDRENKINETLQTQLVNLYQRGMTLIENV